MDRFGWLRLAVNQRREAFDSSGVIRDVPASGASGGGGGGGGRGGGSSPATFNVRSFAIDRHVDVYSTGAEWQLRPLTRLGTVLGAAVNAQQRPGGVSETDPTWLAGVTFDATDMLRLRASASRKIRVPSIDQLFNTSSGNPSLRSEHANAVDAGADYRIGTASTVGVSAFTTHARDFIERLSGLPFANQDRYRFRGTELTFQTARVPRLDLRGGYSYLHSVSVTPAAHATAPDTAASSRQPRMGVVAARRFVRPRRGVSNRLAALRLPWRHPHANGSGRLYAGRYRIDATSGPPFRAVVGRDEPLRPPVRISRTVCRARDAPFC